MRQEQGLHSGPLQRGAMLCPLDGVHRLLVRIGHASDLRGPTLIAAVRAAACAAPERT
jgi:hypothetical protein